MIIFHVVKLIDILRVDKEALLLIVVHSVYVVVISALGSALGLVGGVRWYTTDDHPSWARNRSAINAGPESAIIRETLLLHGTSTSIEVLRVNICLTLCHAVGTISVWLIFVFGMLPLVITHFIIEAIVNSYQESQRDSVDAEKNKQIEKTSILFKI